MRAASVGISVSGIEWGGGCRHLGGRLSVPGLR
jgi:hypothetical protein